MKSENPKLTPIQSEAAASVLDLSTFSEVVLPADVKNGVAATVQAERRWADLVGIGLSGLCLVHCLLTPVLLLLLPSLQLLDYHEVVHRALFVILPVIALGAFIPGYFRHRDMRVFAWSVPGLLLLLVGAFVYHDQLLLNVLVNVSGSSLLIRAHLMNRRLCESPRFALGAACSPGCSHKNHFHPR